MLSIDKGFDPLLKRPFSIHRIVDNDFQLLYKVVGKGTYILSKKKPGDILDVIGPLGNGFPVNKTQNNIILVAGGLGIAPIFALAEKLIPPIPPLKKGEFQSPPLGKPVLFYGARTKKELLCTEDLKSIGISTVISTDDGSFGHKGSITDILKKHLSRYPSLVTDSVLFACGPKPMLKSLSSLSRKNKIKGYITLEENMACGLGACLGCVINTKNGFKCVCKDGPVFSIDEIIWE